MPYTNSLEKSLGILDLRGTQKLHIFNSHKDGGLLKGQSFALLRDASFNYHAHCCQLKQSNYSYYKPDLSVNVGRKREASSYSWDIFQKFYDYFLGESRSSKHTVASNDRRKVRYTRQTVSDEDATTDLLTCLNYTDLNIELFLPATEIPVTEATEEPTTTMPDECTCGGSQECDDCVTFNCDNEFGDCTTYQRICDCMNNQRRRKRNTVDNSSVEETNNVTVDLLPEGWFFHPNSTDLICTENVIVNITTHVYRPCTYESPSPIAPSHTVSAVPDISPTPTTLQTDIISAFSLSTMAMAEISTPIATPSPATCSSSIVEVFCMLTAAPTPPPTPTLPPCDCGDDVMCQECEIFSCDLDYCDDYRHICDGNCSGKRRRRYTTAVEEEVRQKRHTSDTLLPDGWFYPNPDNTSFVCIPVSENSTDVPMTSLSTTPSTTDPLPLKTCDDGLFAIDGSSLQLQELATMCTPLEDPFNPCEDLLGKDHVLRSFIWIVIILALVGNSLVILVFLGYSVIIKRTKVELFVVHFFYFNLAVADFFMGIYLFTIAVQDLRTLGNFSKFDITWRTQGGCDFAGFCAITSTMVSVYILLVITVERLYTFSRALQKSHTSKTTAIILMAVGWGFGILMGILPVITKDVNDYTRTAICLPFDVSSKLALSYILFLLLFTGVVFMAIAISYVIIFFQVFYCRKAISVSDQKRWKLELKVALRMGTLVLTNFVCWFPIALLGISAAVGNSLINNITFAKWVMVFIFPINACLNPILYSVLSKVFRDNLILTLGKCGLCSGQISRIRRHRAGFTPSVISNRSQVSSKADLVSDSGGGTIIERFRNFSITSTTNLLGRRSSTMSQASSEERYQIELIREQRRRSSEYSSASSEDILGVKVNSRRGSAFSGGSVEDVTTFSNPGFRSSSPVGGSAVADGAAGNHKGSPRPRISLGAVPEENENFLSEISVTPEPSGESKQNPAYSENDTKVANTLSDKNEQQQVTSSSQSVDHHIIIDSETGSKTSTDGTTEAEHDSGVHSVRTDSVVNDDCIPKPSRDSFLDYNCSQEVVSIEFD